VLCLCGEADDYCREFLIIYIYSVFNNVIFLAMRKKCLLIGALMGAYGAAFANADDPNAVMIELKNHTTYSYVLEDSPELRYRNDSLFVKGSVSLSYSFSDVSKYYFARIPMPCGNEGVPEVQANEVRVTYLDNKNVLIEGLSESAQVGLFTVLGELIKQTNSSENGVVQLSLPDIKGVYIVKVNDQSIKLIKK
jgi:hypothetical protein